MTLPRRIPPDRQRRLGTALTAHASLSGHGQTRAARPVPTGGRSGVVIPAPGASAILASGWFSDDSEVATNSHAFDPSDLTQSQGPIGDYAEYFGGTPGIKLLVDGWYQVSALAAAADIPAGAWVGVQITGAIYGDDPQFNAWGPDGGGDLSISVTSTPMYRAAGEVIRGLATCTATATFQFCSLIVVKFAD